MKDLKNQRYRLEDVEIDVQNLRVTVGSETRPLEPKSFRLLLFLVENPGRVLANDEIMAAVWPDAVVSDNSLARAITQIRKALDDDPKAPRFIETIPTAGYRFIGDIKAEHIPVETPDAPVHSPAVVSAPGRVRLYRWAAIAGAVAAVTGLAVGGWWAYSQRGRALTNKDTIVLADFANSTGDPVFDDALKQGLAVQLSQSPLFNLLPEQRVRSALQEMTRSPDQALTASLAREVCERTGSKAYIAGSIANLGGAYVIGLNATQCTTGDVLAREQIEAGDKQHVLAALGAIAEKLRKKLGESLGSIQRFDVPPAQATTSSLEALKAYSLALAKFGKGDQAGAIPLFQQAIELDPDFAIAYANLGRAYQNLRQHDRMEEALRKAFVLRNRTSQREKYDILAVYHQFVTRRTDEVIQTCELWVQTYPLDFTPHRILGYEFGFVGRNDRSVEEFRKATELDPGQLIPYSGQMLAYMALDRLPEAGAAYQEARAHKLEPEERYLLAFLEGDRETMTKIAASLEAQPGYKNKALSNESLTEAYFGHLGRAQQILRHGEDAALGQSDKATTADFEAKAAFLDALFGNLTGARQHASAALTLGGQPAVALASDGYPVQLTLAMALAGDTGPAANVADRLAGNTQPGSLAGAVWIPEIRAAIELKRGNPTRAVELLAAAAPYEGGWADRFLSAYLRGEAYREEHRGREAAAEFQKIINHPGAVLNLPIGALSRLGIARSYALEGDITKAGVAYQDFLTLWKDADPDIPILIAAKTEVDRLK